MKNTMKKATTMLLAAGILATAVAGTAFAEEEHYAGFEVYYHGDEPEANADVEITSEDEIVWTIASCMSEDNPQSVELAHIAEELDEKTDGKFTWDIYYNSELGSENEAVELVRNNTAQFVTSNVTVMPNYVERIGVFALPYLYHSAEDMLTYLSTSEMAYGMWNELEETAGLVTLGFQCSGSRCLSTKGVDTITCPDDLNGVKVRCMDAQVWQNVIASLGATPVPIAYTELYTALQTGVVSGQDNPAANTVDGKFYEVLDKFYETNHCYLISGFYTNSTAWGELPDDYKALLESLLATHLGDEYKDSIAAFTEECYATMEEAGVEIIGQDQLDMDAFYESANAMIEENYMSDEAYVEVIDDVKATFGY